MGITSFFKPSRVLGATIAIYIASFSYISLWKYDALRYNARDLAIYNQVVWQLAGGESGIWNLESRIDNRLSMPKFQILYSKFYSSIQGHNYLGDHVEPILLLLVPFYRLFPDPRTLLVLQALALALAAWPLYLISQTITRSLSHEVEPNKNSKTQKLKNWTPAFIGALWLLHPAVQNANLFEFHSLAFAPFFLFFLFYSYLRLKDSLTHKLKNYLLFTLTLLLSLSVREDVALIIFMLGLLMLGKGLTQRTFIPIGLLTLRMSAGWFMAAQKIIAHFSPSQGYQYRIYYAWLTHFNSFGETVQRVLTHLFTLQNIEMLLGLLLPLLFLPLLKPNWLLLILPPLAAILLSAAGGSSLVWQMHYSLLLLPGIFLSLIHFLQGLLLPQQQQNHYPFILRSWYLRIINNFKQLNVDTHISVIALLTAALASMLSFGPVVPAAKAFTTPHRTNTSDWGIIASVPPGASVASTDRFLAPLSSRPDLTLLPLRLLGVQQYGVAAYEVTPFPDVIILDEADVWADVVQARSIAWTRPSAPSMLTWFRRWLENGNYQMAARDNTAVLLTKEGGTKKIPLFSFEERELENVNGWLVIDRLGSVLLKTDERPQIPNSNF